MENGYEVWHTGNDSTHSDEWPFSIKIVFGRVEEVCPKQDTLAGREDLSTTCFN